MTYRRSPWFCMWVVLQPPRIFDISSGRRQVNPGRLPGEGKFHHDGTKDGTASSKQASKHENASNFRACLPARTAFETPLLHLKKTSNYRNRL